MPVLGTLPNDKAKLVGLYVAENSKYQTLMSKVDVAKRIAQDVNESPERRAEFRQKYETAKKELDIARKNTDKLQEAVDKIDGGKALTKVQNEYERLLESKSLLIDPNDPEAAAIDAKIEKLVKPFQNAYSKTIGTRVSETVARAKLLKKEIPGFGEPTGGQTASEDTGTPLLKRQTSKTANDTTPNKITSDTKLNKGNLGNKGDIKVEDKIPLDTQTFESTFTTGGVPAGYVPSKKEGKTPGSLDQLLQKTEFWYDLPDYIFKIEPKLGELLVKAVDEEWDDKKFLAAAQQTPWWQKNAGTIRTRIVDREKYNDLRASGEDVSKTEYGIYLGKQMRNVKDKAQKLAGVTLTDEQAQTVAQKIYDGFLDDDPVAITALITPYIGKTTSIVGTGTGQKGYGGEALKNYQTLQEIAKRNGFSVKDVLPNISTLTAGGNLEDAVLRKLANGELDLNRISQDARMMAAQGQPQYVRDLLNQGYDLQDIYTPYIKQMATELDLDPNTIDLNDSTLRMAITDKGDMNLYDFKKALRKDDRWQYTQNAIKEVSTAALGVLKDFGFQG